MSGLRRAALMGFVSVFALIGPVAHGAALGDRDTDATVHSDQTRIIGGKQSTDSPDWVTYVSDCGGTLIAPRWVVTAAHCLRIKPYKVRIGSRNRWEGGENLLWSNVYMHPKYKPQDYENTGYDIGLVELSTASKYTPAPIARQVAQPGTATRLWGWGDDKARGVTLLKELDTSVLSADKCANVGGKFNAPFEVCTNNPSGQGACYGDSGGPQAEKVNGRWELIGVTSRGPEKCATAPSIYTSVPAHLDWIREVSKGAVP